MNIYLANVGPETSEEQVRDAFTAHGAVDSVKLISDPFTGRLKGFGFVEMPDNEEAESAISALNNSTLDGHLIVVNEARPKAEKKSFNSSYRR